MSKTSGKTIIVTGASRGLGNYIVKNILADYPDANVVMIARNNHQLLDFHNTLSLQDQSRVMVVSANVTNREAMISAIEETLKRFGKIDGIVFNAGMIEPVGHLDEANYDLDGMKKLFDVNFFSIVMFANETLTRIRGKPINIVFVSSGASTRGIDGWLAYGSSKAAVNSLCKQLHDEMYPTVKCISVAPGVVDTDMQKEIREKFQTQMTAESYKRFVDLHSKGELLDGMVVGKVYGRLVVEGIEPADEVCGEYVRWNDRRLERPSA